MFDSVRYFTYEAAHHCVDHALARFGLAALEDGTATDVEGNPVSACFTWDECGENPYCDECLFEEVSERWASEATND